MYDKISLHFRSMLLLASGVPKNEIDISLIASAARNIMECTNLFYYFSNTNDSEQFEFQEILFWLNDKRNAEDIFGKLGIDYAGRMGELYEFGYEHQLQRIKENGFFQSLPKQNQQYILSGRKNTYKMSSPKIISQDLESALYNLFSNSVHSLYGGISSNSLNASAHNSSIKPISLLVLAFEISGIYYTNVTHTYLLRRYRLRKYIEKSEMEHLSSCANPNSLLKWIDDYKDGTINH